MNPSETALHMCVCLLACGYLILIKHIYTQPRLNVLDVHISSVKSDNEKQCSC